MQCDVASQHACLIGHGVPETEDKLGRACILQQPHLKSRKMQRHQVNLSIDRQLSFAHVLHSIVTQKQQLERRGVIGAAGASSGALEQRVFAHAAGKQRYRCAVAAGWTAPLFSKEAWLPHRVIGDNVDITLAIQVGAHNASSCHLTVTLLRVCGKTRRFLLRLRTAADRILYY
mmetsp:Transcript_32677/g.84684  ORF Transcript_32677/g.84684 Transcript_32677/m.84684 type:complete len:174 (-) Transcript_32677:959-1480(-)